MTVDIEGVTLHLAHPDELPVRWVGQEELMRQLLAAWMVLNEQDLPMTPRLLGKPGVGKTTLAYAAAKRMERDEEFQILKENLPFAEDRILNYVTDFLQRAHAADERYTARDGINIGRFAIKLATLATDREHERSALETAILEIVGQEALRYTRGS